MDFYGPVTQVAPDGFILFHGFAVKPDYSAISDWEIPYGWERNATNALQPAGYVDSHQGAVPAVQYLPPNYAPPGYVNRPRGQETVKPFTPVKPFDPTILLIVAAAAFLLLNNRKQGAHAR